MSEIWPPAPSSGPKLPDDAITHCPHCKHKLLTHKSVLCNWCGARIEDPLYQARAAEERARQDAAIKQKLQEEVEETQKYGPIGRLRRKAKILKKEGHSLDLDAKL
jgi:uncharacterized Zn finger protein (UPF0148 family)